MTLIIKLPGTLTDTTGLPELVKTVDGFPELGLTDLFLFEDGSGTTPENSIAGRGAGLIEAPSISNNAFAWLSGGGGLSLSGTQIMSAPASDASEPWTMVSVGSMVASVGGTASERVAGVMSLRNFGVGTTRGAGLYMRGGNDWNSGSPVPYYQTRAANGGAQAAAQNLLPTNLSEIGQGRVRVFSYNGTDTLTASVYATDGALVATVSYATDDAQMFTVSGTTIVNLQPCLGIGNLTYSAGQQEIEAFARYDRALSSEQIATIASAAAALGSARGRAWA